MALSVWRRLHGTAIVAEVSAGGGGAWSARVWLASNVTVSVTTPRRVGALSSAQENADWLARKTFDHQCDRNCGAWTQEPPPVPEADE